MPPHPQAPGSLTTPDPIDLHRCLDGLAAAGIDHLALEASSHGLDQYRLDGVRVAIACFTNLSRDHLDYHGSTKAYLAAKRRLFAEILAPDGTAVINADDAVADDLAAAARARGARVMDYGRRGRALRLVARRALPQGQELEIALDGRGHHLSLPLIGAFQAHNALAALAIALAGGAAAEPALALLATLPGVPGRLETVARTPAGAHVLVDYAHTPDALDSVLAAVRPHTRARLIVVFGCGGDRDRGKRPMMGTIAGRLADLVIVTDDNPRGEDPARIRAEILAGAPDAREIGDRGEAIAQAMATAGPGDVLVIAGKGHESGQIVGDRVLPFDDRAVARATAARLGGEAS